MAKNKRAFTLIELMAAVGVLALIIAFTSIIFSFGIDAHRVSVANAEIMQKARAITEQLNSDFRGLRKDAPMLMWYLRHERTGEPDFRTDQIMFFTIGDFYSTQLYQNGRPLAENETINDVETIRGNLARIHYAHSHNLNSVNRATWAVHEKGLQVLARRQHILTPDPDLEYWPDSNDIENTFGIVENGFYVNDQYEHDSMPYPVWKSLTTDDFVEIKRTCFASRPKVDMSEPRTYHQLMCQGVTEFIVQWSYWYKNENDRTEMRWFPSHEPYDDNDTESHFDIQDFGNEDYFGVMFNVEREGSLTSNWEIIGNIEREPDYGDTGERFFSSEMFPTALKFTFTVYDRKQVIEGGKTFTHVVYLDD